MSNRLVLFFIAFALAACGQATSTPIVSPTAMIKPTITSTPAPTSTPTLTPTISPTPFSTLSSDRPYLALEKKYLEETSITKGFLYDANGDGRQTIELPESKSVYSDPLLLKQSISPDGQWVAFYTGNFELSDTPESFPITLKLLNLKDGTIKTVADVATADYPQKLDQIAEQLKTLAPDFYASDADLDNENWLSDSLHSIFKNSVDTLAWSSDGRNLAFAAQIDGISLDIYRYDLETGDIWRVEDSLQNVGRILWSPDDKYIVFENKIPSVHNSWTTSVCAVEISDQVVKEPQELESKRWPGVWGWLSPTILLTTDGSHTSGDQNLRTIDIRTGQIKELWENAVSSFDIDYKNKMILLNTSENTTHDWGLYFVSFDGRQRKILDGIYYITVMFRGEGNNRFIAAIVGDAAPSYSMYKAQVVDIDPNGKITPFAELSVPYTAKPVKISPDALWLVMFKEHDLFLYDKNDQLIRTIAIPKINAVSWRPDSKVIFYTTENQELYMLAIPDGEPKLVDSCNGYLYCRFELEDAIWLR